MIGRVNILGTIIELLTLSTFYLTLAGIKIPNLKSIRQFNVPKFINQKAKNRYDENGHTDLLVFMLELPHFL